MDDLDPFDLDRRLARAATRWRRWRRRLDQGLGLDEDPFEPDGTLAGRTTFHALGELPDVDPLKRPLQRWVYRLAEQRIDREALVAVEAARRYELHPVEAPEGGRYPLAALLARALSEPARRHAWLHAFIDRSHTLSGRVALLWERRAEIAHRMGLDSPDAIELCGERARARDERSEARRDARESGGGATDLAYEPAARWLASSADMASEHLRAEAADFVELALGRDAGDGWPARITPRALGGLLDAGGLLDSVRLDPGALPAVLGVSSFLRALRAVGIAWREALAPAHQPFVVAHDPYALESHATGALFALMPLSRPFLKRQLDLGTARAREHQRAVARVLLLESRAAAMRVLLRPAALAGHRAFAEAHEARVHEALGVELPGSAAGALWRLRVDDAQRFEGWLLAARRAQQLTEDHDEDWFRNPRAADQLRSEAELSPEPAATQESLDAGALALCAALAEALS